jgi:hypothetical protein
MMKKTESKTPIEYSSKDYSQKDKLLLTFYFFIAFLVFFVPKIVSSVEESIKLNVFTKCCESHHYAYCDYLRNESGVSDFWYMLGFIIGGGAVWLRWIMNWPYIFNNNQKAKVRLSLCYNLIAALYIILAACGALGLLMKTQSKMHTFDFYDRVSFFAPIGALVYFDWLATNLTVGKKHRIGAILAYGLILILPYVVNLF